MTTKAERMEREMAQFETYQYGTHAMYHFVVNSGLLCDICEQKIKRHKEMMYPETKIAKMEAEDE